MNVTQSYMDQTDWVERYAWFGAFRMMPGGLSSVSSPSSVFCALPTWLTGTMTKLRPSNCMTTLDISLRSDDSTSVTALLLAMEVLQLGTEACCLGSV
jgi:hypothetical protein